MLQTRRALRMLLALAATIAGCEALVDGKLHLVLCDDEGVVGPPACLEGFECRAGTCIEVIALEDPMGSACMFDHDCGPGGVCLDPLVFGDSGGARCSRPCCTSSDCDPQRAFVCASPPGGGPGFCREAAVMDIVNDIGKAKAGAVCAHDEDCRSGRCDGVCSDGCCSDTACAEGAGACKFDESPPDGVPAGFACALPGPDKKARYAPCSDDDDCASGLCLALDGIDKRCSSPCCTSVECEAVDLDGELTPVACAFVPHGGVRVRACSAVLPQSAVGVVGVPCVEDAECRGGLCIGPVDLKQCSDACCSERDCGDSSVFGCVLGPEKANWALRCERK